MRRARTLAGLAFWLLLSASLVFEAARPGGPMVDEAEWITSGYVAWQLLAAGAPPSRWERAFAERGLGDWGNKNPPLGKYLIGLAVSRHVHDDAAVQYRLQFTQPVAGEQRVERAPPAEMLISARVAIALSASACLLAVYLIALELTGASVWAVLAPLALFLLPGFQHHAVRVYTDPPQIALLGFATWGLLRHARSQQLRALALAAICAGLACAVKLSAGAWCVGAGLYLLFCCARDRRTWRALVLFAALSSTSFVAVNPYLYPDPYGRTLSVAHDWRASKARQQADVRLADTAVVSPARSMALVSARGVFAPTSTPLIHSLALNAMEALLPLCLALAAISFGALWVTGRWLVLKARARSLGLQGLAFALGSLAELVLSGRLTLYGGAAALGLLFLARAARDEAARAFVCVFLVTWIATGLWLPFDWARYYLPVVSLSAVVYALAAQGLANQFGFERRAAWVQSESLGSGLAFGVTALAALAFGWVLISIVTPPLLP